jgi:hypothetical protein
VPGGYTIEEIFGLAATSASFSARLKQKRVRPNIQLLCEALIGKSLEVCRQDSMEEHTHYFLLSFFAPAHFT